MRAMREHGASRHPLFKQQPPDDAQRRKRDHQRGVLDEADVQLHRLPQYPSAEKGEDVIGEPARNERAQQADEQRLEPLALVAPEHRGGGNRAEGHVQGMQEMEGAVRLDGERLRLGRADIPHRAHRDQGADEGVGQVMAQLDEDPIKPLFHLNGFNCSVENLRCVSCSHSTNFFVEPCADDGADGVGDHVAPLRGPVAEHALYPLQQRAIGDGEPQGKEKFR